MDVMHDFASCDSGLTIKRSTFSGQPHLRTTFNAGKLVPLGHPFEVLPGDTIRMDCSALVRMITPYAPVMDDAYLDVYFFWTPLRQLWSHFEEEQGANKSTFWDDPTDWIEPCLDLGSYGTSVSTGNPLDYLGVPPRAFGLKISALPLANYLKIWDEWFRDENLQAPHPAVSLIYNAKNNADVYPNLGFDASDSSLLLSVNKYHDLFTSCLPSPQKGDPVQVPVGGQAPLDAGTSINKFSQSDLGLQFSTVMAGVSGKSYPLEIGGDTKLVGASGTASSAIAGNFVTGTNLYADLSKATGATVNELRLAFQTQKLLERDARGGTRYVEMLKSHFGVAPSSEILNRSELLGSIHQRLNMTQVNQTSQPSTPSGDNSVGSTGAYSATGLNTSAFVKSFKEFGYVQALCCVRVKHSYGQGLHKVWSRFRRFDRYYPEFANVGEMPIYKREILAKDDKKDEVFGFNEAFVEYRYFENQATGLMRPDVSGSVGKTWSYVDDFSSVALNGDFITEQPSNIDNTIIYQSSNGPVQFKADFMFDIKATRPMPVKSYPGLIDHN